MQENISDNQLIELINSGEYKYLQLLINRYMPYIISTASNYNAGGFDTEDFIQEGILAIFSAVKTYDSSKASFKTFVSICITRAMSSALARASGAAKHIPESLISSIEDVELADMSSPESILIEKENYTDLAETIKKECKRNSGDYDAGRRLSPGSDTYDSGQYPCRKCNSHVSGCSYLRQILKAEAYVIRHI